MPETLTLPMPVEELIPHRLPMRLVDSLVAYADQGEQSGTVEVLLTDAHLLVGGDGQLNPAAMLELMAQAYAAIKGYEDRSSGKPVSEGFLVGIRKLALFGTARSGDRLRIAVQTLGSVDGFYLASASVRCGEQLLAQGNLKLWVPAEAGRGSA